MRKPLPALCLVLALPLLGCPGGGSGNNTGSGKGGNGGEDGGETAPLNSVVAAGILEDEPAPKGPAFTLGEGSPPDQGWKPVPAADAQPLDAAATQALLDRLPPLETEPGQSFARRQGPPPPPLTGETVKQPFPAREGPPPVDATPKGPLEVLRFMPEGDVPLAPHLSITFSQPMVPVGSLADVAKEAVPVRLTPQPKGAWRWVSTTTLLFEPDPRFPMATEYRVEVPAGTRSTAGGALAKDVSWEFRTPPLKLVQGWPQGGPLERDPLLLATFDQAIDPAAVLGMIQVHAGGDPVKLRLATEAEAQSLAGMAQAGRTVLFRATEVLPGDASVTVTIGAGTPSAEGPRRTTAAESFGFRTYGPLKVTHHASGYGDECPPGAPFIITFSNPLDAKRFSSKQLTLEPAVKGLRASCFGQQVHLRGATKANTTYRATLAPELADVFGQTLGESVTLDFETTDPTPGLYAIDNEMVILDPAGKAQLTVRSMALDELRVVVRAVDPATDWQPYREWRGSLWNEKPAPMPGRRVFDGEVDVKGSDEEWLETAIDVSGALKEGLGHAIVHIEPVDWPNRWKPRVVAWIQSTKLGLDVQHDAKELLAWVTRLEDGAPVEGAEVRFRSDKTTASTDATGVARLTLGGAQELLLAKQGHDTAFLPGHWSAGSHGEQLRWFTFDDRHLYRPGEDVRVKGWVRRVDLNEGGDVLALDPRLQTMNYTVHDAHGQEIKRGQVRFDPLGGFDLAFELPDTVHVGTAQVDFGGHAHSFQIAEFRRPEFEVTVAPGGAGPHLAGDDALVTATATYFAGGALPGAPVTWRVRADVGHFTPPNRRDFVFGEHLPWWLQPWGGRGSMEEEEAGPRGRGGWGAPEVPALHEATFTGVTDAQGKHHLRLDLNRVTQPLSISAEATVADVNRQAWTVATALLVHPSRHYVGLRVKKPYFGEGEAIDLDALVVGIDGEAVAGREVQVELARMTWDWVDQEGYRERVVERVVRAVTSGKDPVRVQLEKPAGGTWKLTAVCKDEEGRRSVTSTQLWVAGGAAPSSREVEEERVTLVPDREHYGQGDTAEVLVVAPFAPAEAMVTFRRSGIVRHERVRLEKPTYVLTVPIDDAMVPDLTVHVALVGSQPRDGADGAAGKRRPAFAAGQVTLKIPPRRRTLDVAVTPAARELEPGATTSCDLVVRDHAGQPVSGAEVCVAVVDEAVLALAGHELADPLSIFYAPRGPGAGDARARAFLRLQVPAAAAQVSKGEEDGEMRAMAQEGGAPPPTAAMAPGGAERSRGLGGGGAVAPPIALRKDLSAMAHWSPRVTTDGAGRAKVELKLPDSLTRWRVIAVAAAGTNSFGARESTMTARLPLMVRPSAPRFLNFGDRFELPIVVQNQSDTPLEVEVAVRASNLSLTAGQGRKLTVPAHDRREVRFPAAAQRAGRARLQVAICAASNVAWSDAQELTLPVWTPATSEAFATTGTLDGEGDAAVAQPIAAPLDAWPELGGLEVTTASTNLQALTDAVIYLVDYPYGCAEQVSSRMLALVAIRDVLEAFQVPQLPSAKVLNDAVAADLRRLKELQNPNDGGWGFWKPDEPSWPYLTIHVLHALARTQEKGYPVDKGMLAQARTYVTTVERRIPDWYSPESRRALVAYALFARARLGDADVTRARGLLRESGGVPAIGAAGLSFEAAGWLYPMLRRAKDKDANADATAVRRLLSNRVVETAGAAHFATSYSDGAHVLLHSDLRTDGVLLEALLDDPAEATGDLAPKLVQGLLGHRKRGHWSNTQENAFVLLALDAYFRTAERLTPDFVARAWLGDAFAGEHGFKGRTTERAQVTVPMAQLQEIAQASGDQAPSLTIAKQGSGRLYYRIALRYAPRDLKLDPLEAGFSVQRRYEAVDDPADVRRDADGTYRIKAGARVRVRLTMVAPSQRVHVALVDPLPAGLEPLDPALRSTGALPQESSRGRGAWWWWSRTWYEHSGLRDERAEAFTSMLWAGVHTFDYTARATTPGVFVAPPAKAEEMYAPETFGRSGTDRVIVE